MGLLGTGLSVDSFIGVGSFGIQGIILLMVMTLLSAVILGVILYIFWLTGFRYSCIIYEKTKSGISQQTKRGGLRRSLKSRRLEFKIKGEKFRINNFDKNKIINSTKKGKPTIYLFRRKNDFIQILDLDLVEVGKEGEKELKFIAESLGESDWEGDFEERTSDMFTIKNFWSQYGRDVVYISAMITLAMIVLVAVTQI